jgi:hypothetical protein
VVKSDPDGRPQWTRVLGGRGSEYGYGCTALNDGYLVVGYTASFGHGSRDVYVVKLTADGDEVWARSFGGASWDVGRSIIETSDGHYMICGYTHSSGKGEEDLLVIKIDRDGKEIWSRTFGGERSELGYVVRERDDGQYLVAGITGTFGHEGNTDCYLLCLDRNGDELWSNTYGFEGPAGHGFDWCTAMEPAPGGGCVLVGYTDSEDIMNAFATRVDPSGQEIWSTRFGWGEFSDFATGVAVRDDGSVTVCGVTKSVGTPDAPYHNNIGIAWLDTSGARIREKTIEAASSDWASSLRVTARGGLLVAGRTKSATDGDLNSLLMLISEQELETTSPGYSGILSDSDRPTFPVMYY